jgi:hypothetical protein
MKMTPAERLWVAARTDAAMLAVVRGAYRGRLDVLDALWWRAHPLTPTPDGRQDPAAELAPLQAAVYSRAAVTEPGAGSEQRLAALTAQLAADGAALDTTLERFAQEEQFAQREQPAANRGALAGGALAAEAGAGSFTFAPQVEGPAVASWRANGFLLIAAGAALGVLVTIGVQAIQGQPVVTDAAPGSSTLSEYYDSKPYYDNKPSTLESTPAEIARAGSDMFQVFAGAPGFAPGQGPDLGPDYLAEWTRQVGMPDDGVYATYVSRNDAGEYCLIVAAAKGSNSAACGVAELVSKSGLTVHALVDGKDPGLDGPEHLVKLEITAMWSPDGSISTGVNQWAGP